ncbi:MAG: hypothetical protein GX442_18480 [Candidatus Riflebacteria bacterium]|nr:hypothetical protein [Candidatus Riflebacteria bacterium]
MSDRGDLPEGLATRPWWARAAGSWPDRLAHLGVRPGDTEVRRAHKAGLTLMAATGLVAGFLLGCHDLVTGFRTGLVLTWTFAGLCGLALLFLHRTGRLGPFRFFLLTIILAFPVTAQCLKGGFAAGGSGMIWALAAPVGAALFHGFRASCAWFVLYLALTLGLAAGEARLAELAPPLADRGTGILFAAHIGGISLVIFLTIHYFHFRLRREQRKSENLLLNILPREIIERLKEEPEIIADSFPEATILFADLAGFTAMAGTMPAARLVTVLNHIVTAFDDLSTAAGLEKIKTIGDAYLVVAGVPTPRPDHLEAMASFALAMRESLTALAAAEGLPLRLRIGIHTGPVVAGVIGRRKFTFDLWGDAVNVASRMESTGEPDRIQVSEEVRRRLGDRFRFSGPRRVQAKGKGELTTWFLEGEAPPPPPAASPSDEAGA